MRILRRRILSLIGGLATGALSAAQKPFDVDRLIESQPGSNCGFQYRKYSVSATVRLLSIPIFSRAAVGSGYALVETRGRMTAIQFAAGSYPERAHGLNRLGFIQEVVVDERPGCPEEFAWLAFMTTSQEKNLDQAKKALEARNGLSPYSVSQGSGRGGWVSAWINRLQFETGYTWRNLTELVTRARAEMARCAGEQRRPVRAERGATFLYSVRRAMLDESPRTSASLVFNDKRFRLDTQKRVEAEEGMVRMDAALTEWGANERTTFRMWYRAGKEQAPPLRFEYQATPFLRLSFDADDRAEAPPIMFALRTKEAA